MDKEMKILGFGFLTWVIPFVVSFFFFDVSTGKFIIDEIFFKSIMIVLSTIVGSAFLIKYFSKIKMNFVREGAIVGMSWCIINWVLDFVILLPMSEMDPFTYFIQIGMRYLNAPIIAIAMGILLSRK